MQNILLLLLVVAMPALQSGNDSRPTYLPMELCTILPGQRYTRKLNERQVTALPRATCQRPRDREANIIQMVRQNNYNGDNLIKDFGMQVKQEMMLIDARVLPSPKLNYHDTSRESRETAKVGQWNMINKKMVNGGKVDFWAYVNFSRLDQDFPNRFLGELVNMCSSKGVHFHGHPLLPIQAGHPGKIESVLRGIHQMATKKFEEIGHKGGRSLQLLIIVLPDVSGSYGTIERICEIELGIVSQCCNPRSAAKLSKQYLENLALKIKIKINVKVGGRNTVLNDAIKKNIPLVKFQQLSLGRMLHIHNLEKIPAHPLQQWWPLWIGLKVNAIYRPYMRLVDDLDAFPWGDTYNVGGSEHGCQSIQPSPCNINYNEHKSIEPFK